jgi:hypothetical protein
MQSGEAYLASEGIDLGLCERLGKYIAERYLQPSIQPYPFQLATVVWMLFRETHEFHGVLGGINGHAVGAGKTLQTLLLILIDRVLTWAPPVFPGAQDIEAVIKLRLYRQRASRASHRRATLVVVSKEAKRAWRESIKALFRPGTFTCKTVDSLADLSKVDDLADLIFLSSGLLHSKNRPADFGLPFRRLVFDEAHELSSPMTESVRMAKCLPAIHHWALTASLMHNSLFNVLTILDACLHCQEARLRQWGENQNPPINTAALMRLGLNLHYLECMLLGLGIFRDRTPSIDATSIQETQPALFYNWMLAMPAPADLRLATLVRYPSLAWELWYMANHAKDFRSYVRSAETTEELCWHYGMTMPARDGHHGGDSVNRQMWLMSRGNAYARVYRSDAMPAERILLRLHMFPDEALSPSHNTLRSQDDGASIMAIRDRFANHHASQLIYQAICRGIERGCVGQRLKFNQLAPTPFSTSDGLDSSSSSFPSSSSPAYAPMGGNCTMRMPRYDILFIRPSAHPLEQEALKFLHARLMLVYHRDRLASSPAASPSAPVYTVFNAISFLREATFHLDLLLLTQGDKCMSIFEDCPSVRQYYQTVWDQAHRQTNVPPMTWIARTAWRRLRSTKLQMLKQYWQHSVLRDERAVCFNFYIGALPIIETFFQELLHVDCRVLKGPDTEEVRNRTLREMRSTSGPRLLIATDGFTASGNMVFANHVLRTSIWWTMLEDDQGRGRVDRPGQVRHSYCANFLIRDSLDIIMYKRAYTKELLRVVAVPGTMRTAQQRQRILIDTSSNPISALRVAAHPDHYRSDPCAVLTFDHHRQQQQATGDGHRSQQQQTSTKDLHVMMDKTREIEQTHRTWLQRSQAVLTYALNLATWQPWPAGSPESALDLPSLVQWETHTLPLLTNDDDGEVAANEADAAPASLREQQPASAPMNGDGDTSWRIKSPTTAQASPLDEIIEVMNSGHVRPALNASSEGSSTPPPDRSRRPLPSDILVALSELDQLL